MARSTAVDTPAGVGLTVSDVRVAFGGVTAVDGVSIDVAPGSVASVRQ